jgi:hypothetical protein
MDDVKLVEQSKREISIIKFFKEFNKIKNNPCVVVDFDDYVEVSPTCLLDESKMPTLSIEESLPYLLKDLSGF